MDAGDLLRKKQRIAVYSYYKTVVFAGQTACANAQAACTSLTPCVTTYPSYEEKQNVVMGSQVCNSCANVGCGCGQ